jgi:UPF0716 family protein affecting phage T7 exclusion
MGKYVLGIIAGVIVLILIGFITDYAGLKWYEFIMPQKEAARREVFKETRSYNEGKLQDLTRLRLQYLNAGDDEKEAIASTIRLMFAEYDESKLPKELKIFLKKIKYRGEE